MYREDLGVYLAICSFRRPQNVELMTALVGEATWYLSTQEDANAYYQAGVPFSKIVVVEGFEGGAASVQEKRNQAMIDAWALCHTVCILSDDLRKITWLMREEGGKKGKNGGFVELPISFANGFRRFMQTWEEGDEYGEYKDFKLGGTMPAPNPFYRNLESGVRTTLFVIGDFMVIKPDAKVYLDLRFRVKDDYDYTMAHLVEHGGVYRNDDFMLYFLHNSNVGGLVDERTVALQQADIALLKQKWGDTFVDHKTRANEVLLRFKPELYAHYMSQEAIARLPKVVVLSPVEAAERRVERQRAYVKQRIRNLTEQNAVPDKKPWLIAKLQEGMTQLRESKARLVRFEEELTRIKGMEQ